MLLSETFALGLFITIIIIAIVIAWYFESHEDYDNHQIHIFFAVLAGMGVFLLFLFYFNSIQLQQEQQQLNSVRELARVNHSISNGLLEEIKTASNIIPNFVLSILPLTNNMTNITIGQDEINPKNSIEKTVLSHRIFGLWQEVTLSSKAFLTDPLSYIFNFLQKANSPQLFEQWKLLKTGFNSNAQSFGDLLFEFGLIINNQTVEEYISAAKRLINDPRYKSIFPN